MKKFSIEEKAKAYDEAKLRMSAAYNSNRCTIGFMNEIFPELKENEDCEIMNAIKEAVITLSDSPLKNKCLTWLEKQDKQDNNEDSDILQRFSFYSYKDEPNILYLSGLYVNKECRNKGIGTKILGVADEVANSLNCHAIRLKTKKGSNAERLYQAHGYNSLATEERDEVWLEKKGEQKPQGKSALEAAKEEKIDNANKVEPKFHEGDWVVEPREGEPNGLWHIERVEDSYYWEGLTGIHIEHADKYYHLWTIKDAKDGDVLATDGGVCIFNGILEEGKYPFAYCGITKIRGFESYNGDLPFSHDNNIHPATKEQCNALMKAMADAGYTFDFEKKELNKIEQKPVECSEDNLPEFESYLCLMFQKFRIKYSTKGICTNGEIIDYVMEHSQKLKDTLCHAWSIEDYDMLNPFW